MGSILELNCPYFFNLLPFILGAYHIISPYQGSAFRYSSSQSSHKAWLVGHDIDTIR